MDSRSEIISINLSVVSEFPSVRIKLFWPLMVKLGIQTFYVKM